MNGLRDTGILRLGQIWTMAMLLLLLPGMAFSEEAEQEWPLSLELIWETPQKDEPVFAEGFPPLEIKAAFEDGDIPDEDKEWVLNNIRLWAARKTKKLWLDDGTTMDIPVVEAGEKVRTFTVFPSRNKTYWLVRAMRFEGPEIPPKPEYPGSLTVEFTEAYGYYKGTITLQKAHWREVFMDVDGRMYWEKEFGPYDTYLENSWLGGVAGYVSNDGEVVVKMSRRKTSFCDKLGACVEKKGLWGERAALSADGSTFVVHTGTSRSHRVDMGGKCGLAAYGRFGETKWTTEVVPGGTGGNHGVVAVSEDGARSAFIAVASRGVGETHTTEVHWYVVDREGETTSHGALGSKGSGAVRFSRDGGNLFVSYPHLHLVQTRDAATGNVLWEYRTASLIAGVSVSKTTGGAGIVAVSTYGEGLIILSSDGQPLYRRQQAKAAASPSANGVFLVEKAGGLKISRIVVEE